MSSLSRFQVGPTRFLRIARSADPRSRCLTRKSGDTSSGCLVVLRLLDRYGLFWTLALMISLGSSPAGSVLAGRLVFNRPKAL
jgi:hypothetical protein